MIVVRNGDQASPTNEQPSCITTTRLTQKFANDGCEQRYPGERAPPRPEVLSHAKAELIGSCRAVSRPQISMNQLPREKK